MNLTQVSVKTHNSFDAVSIIKRKTDTKDPYYIYIIKNGNLNNSSDYIFKASKQMTRIALAMDVDGPENVLQLDIWIQKPWPLDVPSFTEESTMPCMYGHSHRKCKGYSQILHTV